MPDAKIIKFPAPAPQGDAVGDARRAPLSRRLRALRERGVSGPAVLQALALQAYEKTRRRPPDSTRLGGRVRASTRAAIREETRLLLWASSLLLADSRTAPDERDDLVWCLRQLGLDASPGETLRGWDRARTDQLVDQVWASVPSMLAAALRA